MKIGDLVKTLVVGQDYTRLGTTGVIIDEMAMDDGFSEYEVLLDDGNVEWHSDLMLEVISES